MNEITQLNPAHVATVMAALKGKRLDHFQSAVELIDESLAAGGWVGRAAQQSTKGFGQGFPSPPGRGASHDSPVRDADHAIRYGSGHKTWAAIQAGGATDEQLQALSPRQPLAAIVAWVEVCYQSSQARRKLDALRKLPQVTPIGLSPKVTETLTGMGMDLDLASIKPTEIGVRWYQGRHPQTVVRIRYDSRTCRNVRHTEPHAKAGQLMVTKEGEPIMLPKYFLDWTEGTVMRASQFAHRDCEACGKTIPSREYVAIEADCKINGHVGLYLGRDCAKNIFGVKDDGLKGKL